jgi:flagellar protein FliS
MTNDHMTPRDAYLETQISTATPQRLRLMLIDAAIRIARQTGDLWHASRNEEALESLIRCRAIISELISGVKPEGSELGRKVVSVYLFLFTTLTEAQLTRDVTKLESAIRVLVEERQTWAQVCEQLADAPPAIPPTPDCEEQSPQQVSGGLMHASASPRFSLDA